MPQLIATNTGRCNVRFSIPPSVLAGFKVLSRTLKVACLFNSNAVLLGKRLGRVLPHAKAAVVALAVLLGESGLTNIL